MQIRSVLLAAAATSAVGSSIVVSGRLTDYPVFTGQALRYGLAALVLLALARLTGRGLSPLPRRHRVRVGLLAAAGMTGFNVAVVVGRSHAEPSVIAVVVGCVPVVLAVVEPLRRRQRLNPAIVAAGIVVAAGAGLVIGFGRTDATGLVMGVLAMAGEAAFTLLASPVLRDVDPWSLAFHSCRLAAVQLAVLAVMTGGAGACRLPSPPVAWAVAYIAVVVTAGAFVAWFAGLHRLGAERAGLFAGLMPVSAAVIGGVTGETTVTALTVLGVAAVGAGITVGAMTPVRAPPRPPAGR